MQCSAASATVLDNPPTCGAGCVLQPFDPPITRPSEDDQPDRYTDEALLGALPLHFFQSAEVLSWSQLADLPSAAQGCHADVASTSLFAEKTSADNHPLMSLPAPQSVSIAAPSSASATPRAPAVLAVSQLACLGVPVRRESKRETREAEAGKEQDAHDAGAAPGVLGHLTHKPNSSTSVDGCSQRHSTAIDEYSGEHTDTEPQTTPPLQASSTCTLPPPPLSPKAEEGVCEGRAALSCSASASPCTPPAHPLTANNSCADQSPSRLSTSPSSPPPPPAPASASHLDPGIGVATPADDLLASLPFDELCRRWMRLLTRTAEPHEQPLCMNCWHDACLVPLQQRTRLSFESANALATMVSSAPAEKQRLLTICYTEPCTTPPQGAVATPDGLGRCPCEAAKTPVLDSKAAAEKLRRTLPLMSLDAVAANLFGTNEEDLLGSLEALSAPHGRALPLTRESSAAPRPSRCPAEIPLEQHITTPAGRDVDTWTASSCSHEAQELMAELEDLQAQQASLDRRAAELRDVLHALESTADSQSQPWGLLGDAAAPSPPTCITREGWLDLAVRHNIREVHLAFTVVDEEAERRHAMANLVTRLAYVSATPIDALCFPIDVSGPVGLIAGLRLGLVPPYSGSRSGCSGLGDHDVRGSGASAALATSAHPPWAHEVESLPEEAMHLDMFVHRQVSYAQLLLSGNTSADGEGLHSAGSKGAGGDPSSCGDGGQMRGGGAAATATAAPVAAPSVNTRVSPLEVNAACGYLLLLLNYLAHVNGFSFHTAVLRPAGDRSTLMLLKRVPAPANASAAAAGGGGAALVATAASFSPLNLFGYFTRGGNVDTQVRGGEQSARPTATPPSVLVADHEVDFYLTDRLLAWRTFGAACVAVAGCVKELADALHESLRCWRVREGLIVQHTSSTSLMTPSPASTVESSGLAEDTEAAIRLAQSPIAPADVEEGIRNRGGADGGTVVCVDPHPHNVPRSLPQLLQELSWRDDPLHVEANKPVSCSAKHKSSGTHDTLGESGTTSAKRRNHDSKSASSFSQPQSSREATSHQYSLPPPAERSRFPLEPPFQTHGDKVDGFSVRHGSVSDAIWTLGMKKLLGNVQWCMGATLELERLYAVAEDTHRHTKDDGDDEQIM
ncbi:hypothetical protein JKF63_07864 [Porcisia hertigi]|uniref:Atg6 BARA domain-containing protein n=1 Tax=Porcisia hertigi TaxID=2761500 RepID=A0A836LJN5_9TRYP|nr:hypothetical protein JKF63_07864 [Porcisia hertigi]